MIRAWEGKNVLSWHLQGLINFHFLLVEVPWIDHCIDIEQNVWVLFKKQEVLLLCSFFEALSVILWDTVPEFWLAPVIVVD